MSSDSVPDKMTACQLTEYKKPYKISSDVSVPKNLNDYDLLIKVAVASLCHTDGMVVEGTFGTALPCIASHEGAGTIAAVGAKVKDFSVGDRVMNGLFRDQCGVCADCQGPESFKQYCPYSKGAIGVHVDGNFAEYVVIDARNAARLPDAVSFETAAPLACAGCTVWRGLLQAELKKGEWLALVGSGGGLGHLGVQFAKALGLNVIGVDARDEGLALSKEMGADIVVDARKGDDDVVKEVHKVTNGMGADATVVISDADSAAGMAAKLTKMHGTMVQIAQPEQVKIPFAELIFRDIRVKGSLISSPEESRQMLKLVAEHGIKVRTNVFEGIKEVPKLVEFSHSGKMSGKGLILIDKDQVHVRQS